MIFCWHNTRAGFVVGGGDIVVVLVAWDGVEEGGWTIAFLLRDDANDGRLDLFFIGGGCWRSAGTETEAEAEVDGPVGIFNGMALVLGLLATANGGTSLDDLTEEEVFIVLELMLSMVIVDSDRFWFGILLYD